jgi:hypothetical protein
VDEGIALLSGREAGERGPDGRFPGASFNAAVERALAENVARLKVLRGESPAPARDDQPQVPQARGAE